MPTNPSVEKVLDVARSKGIIPPADKDTKVSGLVHRSLLDAAKQRTGLTSETALVEYALAKVAIEDDFGERFARLRGSVSRGVELEFWPRSDSAAAEAVEIRNTAHPPPGRGPFPSSRIVRAPP